VSTKPAPPWNEIDSELVAYARKKVAREVGQPNSIDIDLRDLAFGVATSSSISLNRRIRRQFASSAGEIEFVTRFSRADPVSGYLCVLVKPCRIFEAFNFVDREDRYYIHCDGKQIAEVLTRKIPAQSGNFLKRTLGIGSVRVWEVTGNRGDIGAISATYPVDSRDVLTFELVTGRQIPIRVSRSSPGSAEKTIPFKKYWSDVFHGRMPMIEFKDVVFHPASLPMDDELAEIYFCLSIMMRTCYFELGRGVS